MSKTVLESLIEFEQKIEQVKPQNLGVEETIVLRKKLIKEERKEADEALDNLLESVEAGASKEVLQDNMEHLAKELADLVYVTYGTAERLGIDLDAAFETVHASNMSKIGGEHRPDGKLLKPDDYIVPDMEPSVRNSFVLKD